MPRQVASPARSQRVAGGGGVADADQLGLGVPAERGEGVEALGRVVHRGEWYGARVRRAPRSAAPRGGHAPGAIRTATGGRQPRRGRVRGRRRRGGGRRRRRARGGRAARPRPADRPVGLVGRGGGHAAAAEPTRHGRRRPARRSPAELAAEPGAGQSGPAGRRRRARWRPSASRISRSRAAQRDSMRIMIPASTIVPSAIISSTTTPSQNCWSRTSPKIVSSDRAHRRATRTAAMSERTPTDVIAQLPEEVDEARADEAEPRRQHHERAALSRVHPVEQVLDHPRHLEQVARAGSPCIDEHANRAARRRRRRPAAARCA